MEFEERVCDGYAIVVQEEDHESLRTDERFEAVCGVELFRIQEDFEEVSCLSRPTQRVS